MSNDLQIFEAKIKENDSFFVQIPENKYDWTLEHELIMKIRMCWYARFQHRNTRRALKNRIEKLRKSDKC